MTQPHDYAQVTLGVFILWFAWLCFNGVSTNSNLGIQASVSSVCITNSVLAPCAGGIVACVFKRYIMNSPNQSRVDFGGLSNGILAGLVAITASNHTVEAWAALVIGSLGGIFYCLACKLLEKLEIDDPLEVT